MKLINLRASTAVALFLGATAAYAQTPQQEQGPGAAPDRKGGQQQMQRQERAPESKSEPRAESDTKGRSSQNQAEPDGKSSKGVTQKQAEPKDKASKGSAQKEAEPKEKSTKGSAQRDTEPKDKATKDRADRPGSKSPQNKADAEKSDQRPTKAGSGPRPQLSDQQQTRVRETVLKERGARVTNVNFSVRVGTRIPRSVHLVVLPAAVIEVVPEYRNYRYFVVRDEVVIVDPDSYEIVYVLPGRSTTAGGGGGGQALALSDEQVSFVLRNVDLKAESRLAIGSFTVGAIVPRDADLRPFPSLVVEKVPELSSYRYMVYENDVAFVDPNESKVVLVTQIQR